MAPLRKKILCVEDDLETATLIAEEFEERGYEMALAHDGQAGFSAVLKIHARYCALRRQHAGHERL